MCNDEVIFRSKEFNSFIKKTDYIAQKTDFEHKILFYKYERQEQYNYNPYKITNSLVWFNKLNTYNFLSALCPFDNRLKSSNNNIVIYNKINDKNIFSENNENRTIALNFNKIMNYYRIGKTIFLDCNCLKKSYYGLTPKRMINFKQLWWSKIIQEIKDKSINLYQILKSSNAIIKDDKTVEVVVHNLKPIICEFLFRKSSIDIIKCELSNIFKEDIKFKYRILENNELIENELEEIEKFLKLITDFKILDVIKYGYDNRYYSEEYLMHERGIL